MKVRAAIVCLLAALAGGAAAPTPAQAAACTTSVDSLGALRTALKPGATVCVRGTISGEVWINASNVTLTSEPGQTATLRGAVVVDAGASGVTVSDLVLDSQGVGYPSPIILGDDATFARNDITNRGTLAICVIIGALGHHSGAEARNARLVDNRIHDCGGTSDNHRHGVYVEHADGTQIIGNEIYDNADRAIQLYPSAQNSLIAGNVIDGNGEGIIFSGTGGSTSNGNVVRYNVLTNPRLRAVVESWWDGGRAGTGNLVEQNCVAGGSFLIDHAGGGFTARDNLFVDPGYANRSARDFRVAEGSTCAKLLAAGRAGIEIPRITQPAPPLTAAPAPVAKPAPAPLARPLTSTGKRPAQAGKPGTTNGTTKGTTKGKATAARAGSLPKVRASVKRRGRTARVTVRLARSSSKRVETVVEIRWRGRGWRVIGTRRLTGKTARTLRVKVPRRVKGLRVRATAVDVAARVTGARL